MKLLLAILALSGLPAILQAKCTCKQEFSKVRTHIEKNYSGFTDKVTPTNISRYRSFTAQKEQLAGQARNKTQCFFLINQWLNYFDDKHLYTSSNTEVIQKRDKKQMESDFPNDTFAISAGMMDKIRNASGIEGLYESEDQDFDIAVLKNKDPFRDYIGVVVHSENSTISNGKILIELKQKDANNYFLLAHSSNHVISFAAIQPKDGELIQGFRKKGSKAGQIRNNRFEARQLNSETLYINIPGFSWEQKPLIDSLFATQKEYLTRTPNLILDLRFNGGGSDEVYSIISPLLYTQPIITTGVDILASDDNIQSWEALLSNPDFPAESKGEYQVLLGKMKQNKGKNVKIVEDYVDSSFTPLPFPQKVVILINQGCASTTEQFLLEARQSRKVTLMGQYTSGTLDYSNLRAFDFCEMPYTVWTPTTRSRRIDIGQGIDGIGIKPLIFLTDTQDWIQEALNVLSAKNK